MTREEAIKGLKVLRKDFSGYKPNEEMFDMAIEALKCERTDEWCTDCKEYDTEKKCCPRFNKVIREALKREPSEDGTLEVKVEDATKVGRVLISDDKHRGGLYYPDEYEPKGDLISRADAIEAMGEEPPVWCDEDYEIAERSQWRADIEAIKSVPSADRPRPIEPTITVDLESGVVPRSAIETRPHNVTVCVDKKRGEWIDENGTYYANCSKCGYQMDTHEERGYHNFCPNCGADMRETKGEA